MARTHTILATALALFVVAAPATAMGAPAAAGAQAADIQEETPDEQTPEEEVEANDSDELAPGVYENGTVNTTALYQAHREGLLEEGYRTSESLEIELNDSEFLTAETETAGSPDNQNVSATTNLTIVGLEYDIAKWSNETQTVVRIVKDDNATYKIFRSGPPSFAGPPNDSDGRYGPGDGPRGPQAGDGPRGPHRGDGPHMNGGPGMGDGPHRGGGPHMNDGGPQMNDGMGMQQGMGMQMGMMHGMGPGQMPVPGHAVLFLDKITENFSVENETTVDDRTAYTLTAPVNISDDAEGNFTGDVTLVVDEDGVVHAADVTVDSDEYGSETEYTLDLEELGVDTVEQPGWLDEVPENATVYGPPEERPGNGPYDDDSTTETETETGTETPVTP